MAVPLIYKSHALYGLDIGSRIVKFVQLHPHGSGYKVVGYGNAAFASDSIVEGIITEPEALAKTIQEAIAKKEHGSITARGAVAAVPVSKMFTRILELPPMSASDLEQAIHYEAEQYVPVPLNDLYLDYEVIRSGGGEEQMQVLMAAAPRAIVDSYVKLFDYLGVSLEAVESNVMAITRAMTGRQRGGKTTMIIDFGAMSADLAIFDGALRVSGSFGVGGDDITERLTKALDITADQATEIKFKFGIGPGDLRPKIVEALKPQLQTMVNEMRKAIKYYEDRSNAKASVQSVIVSGGSAAMPGITEYLQTELALPVTQGNPWEEVHVPKRLAVAAQDSGMYATAVGLAMRRSGS